MMLNEQVQDGTLITLIGLIYADFYFHQRKSVKSAASAFYYLTRIISTQLLNSYLRQNFPIMSDRLMIIAAFAAVYFIWGSTYLVNYWAIATIPPFLMSGSRFLFAGMLLYAWGLLRRDWLAR